MPWFRVDDDAAFHSKIVAAGNAAVGLWTRAGSWSSRELTDGFIPAHMIASMGTPAQAKKLVQVRLWDKVDGGYQFHQWAERQPFTKADVERKREEARDRMRNVRANKAASSQDVRANESVTESPMSEFLSEENGRLHSERFISEADMNAPSGEAFFESPQVEDTGSREPRTEHDANNTRSSLNPIPSPIPSSGDLGGNRSVGDRGAAANELTPTPNPAPRKKFHAEHSRWVDGCTECEALAEEYMALVAAAAELQRPPGTCSLHPDGTTEACGPCGDARRARKQWEAERARWQAEQRALARQAAADLRASEIAACGMCDAEGYRGTTVCDHIDRKPRKSLRTMVAELRAEGAEPDLDPAQDEPGPETPPLRSVS
ncbi:hypothetical protein [Nocardia asteroides]|uniref:hypothetical protein n=1 Tax=Nocardia asteroides TaxID=1824 RepID=UPI0033D4F749